MRARTCLPLAILLLTLSQPATAQEPPVVNLTAHPAFDAYPTWSPDGTQIAFTSDRGDGGIWVVPATGGAAVQLAAGELRYPAWSPNGDLIAYSRRSGFPFMDHDIWTFPAAGGDHRLLNHNDGPGEWSPAWSPDAAQIAFTSDRSIFDGPNIFVMAATGEPPAAIQLTFDEDWGNGDAEWSPDGTQIAFVTNRYGNYDIVVMPAAGGPATAITDYPVNEKDPAWSPDGTLIAFTLDVDLNNDIWVIPVTGGMPTQRTTHLGNDQTPAWSPDGTKIAFVSDRSGNSDIWVMDLSALAVEPAAGVSANVRLAVSPNPFRDATTIRLADAEGNATLRIVDVAGRLVRELGVPAGASPGTVRTLVWDGRDAGGLAVARGIYYLTLEAGIDRASGRVVRVR